MRRCLTILQSGLYSPLCSSFYSVSQFGNITNGRVHSVARKHTHSSKITKLEVSRASVVRQKNVKFTHPRGTLRVWEIWTAIEVVPSTALPTPSYPDTTGRSQWNAPDTCLTNGERSSVFKRGPAAEEPSNPSSTPERRYFAHREELLNEQKTQKSSTPH